jgi:hypothetical protein
MSMETAGQLNRTDLAVLNTLNLASDLKLEGLKNDVRLLKLVQLSAAYLAPDYVLHIARGATSLYD